MRRLRLSTAGFVLAFVLVIPPAASAGSMGDLVDIIIGLTGPQMVGVPIACQLNIRSKESACYISMVRIPPDSLADETFWNNRRLWLSIGGGAYVSTGKNSEMKAFKFGDVWMLAFEPTVNYRLSPRSPGGDFAVEVGAGLSYFVLFGKDLKSSDNAGIKLTPVALTWRNVGNTQWDFGVAYNLRIFPNAFTAQQFSAVPVSSTHKGREFVHGFTIKASF